MQQSNILSTCFQGHIAEGKRPGHMQQVGKKSLTLQALLNYKDRVQIQQNLKKYTNKLTA